MAFDALEQLLSEPIPVFTEAEYLGFMLDAARTIEQYLEEHRNHQPQSGQMLEMATQWQFTVLRNAPADLLQHYPDAAARLTNAPLGQIESRCAELLEPYYDIDMNAVWKCATDEVPHWRAAFEAERQRLGLQL